MRGRRVPVAPVLACILLIASGAAGHELSGYAALEGRLFLHEPLFAEQKRDNGSFALQPEYYHEWPGGSSFTFVPFARVDTADNERTHFDIRELNLLWLTDAWEMRFGVGKVFWGAAEFLHLVDIINQTDQVENIDGEDKLGQPMVQLSLPRDWGTVDLFVLPGFRERTFPGREGRLRTALVVDTDRARYENAAEEYHGDLAIRYSHTLGDLDLGISHFHGTGREPTLLAGLDNSGTVVLIPFYEQINQSGADLQLVAGNWLLKLEALQRRGQGESFAAAVGGFEYTFVNLAGSSIDLGLISEYAFDDRRNEATTPFENDAVLGLRLALNDAAGSELLLGVAQDLDSPSRVVSVEASRRFGNRWKTTLEAYVFAGRTEDSLLHSLRNDDFVRLELACFF